MKTIFYSFLLLVLFTSGCTTISDVSDNNSSVFPKKQKLSNFNNTEFLATLESPISAGKNGIYSASLLMAWDEIRNEIGTPLTNFTSKELELLNASTNHKEVLDKNEYSSSATIENEVITAKAFFERSLPFVQPLRKNTKPFLFLKDTVSSFIEYGHSEVIKILYYKNDHDFAIKLLTKDTEHEIILIKKTFRTEVNLSSEVVMLSQNKRKFNTMRNNENNWKYYLSSEDEVKIPIIRFNLETNFKNMEGSSFKGNETDFSVLKAYQRTAFILDEKGAEIESEAVFVAATEAMEELPQPKKMIFDSPYIIFLKKRYKKPYFGFYVANSELMEKF